MDWTDYQEEAFKFAKYPTTPALYVGGNYIPMYPVLALGEEAGELQGKIAKAVRDGADYHDLREMVKKELGDVLWNLSAIANHFDLPLQDVAQANIYKLVDRKNRNVISGTGDTR